MNELETIENYLNNQLPADERARFETALRTDPAVADALAFYVLAKHTAKVDAREQRRAELDALRRTPAAPVMAGREPESRTRPLWGIPMGWAAAASVVLLLGLGWYFFRNTTGSPDEVAANTSQLADAYITTNFTQLSTTMGGNAADSLAQGVGLYNDKKYAEAEAIFENVLTRQPDNDRALQYAGIVALRQENYERAIDRFHRLSERTDLLSNPGTFYEALAYLKRGRPMDKSQAKTLLEAVISRNLAGKADAERLLKELTP